MTDPAFEAGARDIRAKRGFPADFDTWPTNTAWNYEQAVLGLSGCRRRSP
jgi:hypothetical protein